MKKYINKFDSHSNYEDFILSEDFARPNVSLCVNENEIHYDPIIEYVAMLIPESTYYSIGEIENSTFRLYCRVNNVLKISTNGEVSGTVTPTTTYFNLWTQILPEKGYDVTSIEIKSVSYEDGETIPNWEEFKVLAL